MTGKEIKKIRTEIPRFRNGVACNLTAEQKQLHRELDCREMINSCLCYGSNFLESRYSEPYIQDLGRERVIEIYNEQKIDFDKEIKEISVSQTNLIIYTADEEIYMTNFGD